MEEPRERRRLNPRFVLLCAALAMLTGCAIGGLWWWLHRGLPGEDVVLPNYVRQELLPENRWSRPGLPLEEINGVVIHYVGNPNTSAEANRNYFASLASGETGTFASSHFIVGLEGEVLQCVPLTEWAYASNERNGDTISIEVCHPDATGKFLPETEDRVVELTAFLCHTFQLEPEDDVIRHYDVTGKLCPKYYVDHPDAWELFQKRAAVVMASMESD